MPDHATREALANDQQTVWKRGDKGRSVSGAKRAYAEANRCDAPTRSIGAPHGTKQSPTHEERASFARARSARSAVQETRRKRSFRLQNDEVPPSAEEAGLRRSLGGELVELGRYFFVHFSTFQVGPWLVALSTRPPC